MRAISLALSIEMSPFSASFPYEFGCSIVCALFFRILDKVSVHVIREEIVSYDQFRYGAWSFDDTSAFVIYFIK